MNRITRSRTIWIAMALGLTTLLGCVAPGPTLDESRRGQSRRIGNTDLQPGETRGEVVAIRPRSNEIQVRSDDNRTRALTYDPTRVRVLYNGNEYAVENLEAGDIIAFQETRGGIIDTIRVQEPVQARTGSTAAGRDTREPRRTTLEGTIERIDYDRGVFDVRTRDRGMVTAALPFNARSSEVDDFRRLRAGDNVRVEGEFINRDNFQVTAFSR
jgi:hypothetical protein